MRFRLVLPFILAAFTSAGYAADQDRAPEPTLAAQTEAEKLVKEVYKEDYAKRGPEERRALAEKLLGEGRNTKSDANTQYVLFREARDMAVQVSATATAMEAIKELNDAFAINAVEMKLKVLNAIRASAHTVDANSEGAEAALALTNEALAAENFDAATKASEVAVTFATGARNIQMTADAQARKNDIKAQATAYLEMKIAADKLKTDPKDGPANQSVGTYLVLFKNDWDKGLPLIAAGNDPTWAAAAKADLANPVDLTEMTKIADTWWDLAQSPHNTSTKAHILIRAEFWYNLVMPNADGIIRAKVEKRIDQIAAIKTGATYSTVSEATRKLLPTQTELQKFRTACAALKNGNVQMQSEVVEQYQALLARLMIDINTTKENDFIARCKAALVLRHIMEANNCGNFANSYSAPWNCFDSYVQSAMSKEDLASRIIAFERFNFTEQAFNVLNFDTVVYSAVRNFVQRNYAIYSTQTARLQLCDFLKNKGVRSSGLTRYRSFVERSRSY